MPPPPPPPAAATLVRRFPGYWRTRARARTITSSWDEARASGGTSLTYMDPALTPPATPPPPNPPPPPTPPTVTRVSLTSGYLRISVATRSSTVSVAARPDPSTVLTLI